MLKFNKSRTAMASTPSGGGRVRYFINRAYNNIRQNIFINLVTVGTITIALLIVSLFMLLVFNIDNAADNWSEKVQITIYFERDVATQEQLDLKNRIQSIQSVSKIKWVSREEAFQRFKGRLKGQETLLDGIRPDILPTSFEISLKKDSRSTEAVESCVSRLKQLPGIGEIQYGEEWVRRFNTLLTFMRIVGGLIGGFLVLAVIFIVSNTIRLTIYARREELEVMWLVGATRLFIKIPFLLEGLIQGFVGGVLSVSLLFGIHTLFLHNSGNFLGYASSGTGLVFLPIIQVLAVVCSGLLLGFLGSLTALRRFINEITG